MISSIQKYLDKPPIYAESEELFWNVEHISKMLLEAHLNPDFEGASRNHQFIENSVSWIKQLVPSTEYRALLDLGCGPGLYTERFSKVGYQVTGIDISQNSIKYAKKSATNQKLSIAYYNQNYINLNMKCQFDFATFIYCDYGALSTINRKIVLANIYHSLKAGGKLLFDVFTVQKFNTFQELQTWELCPNGGFWSSEKYISLNGNYIYQDNTTLEQSVIITDNKTSVYYIWNHFFTKASLIQEVTEVGFKVVEIYGDVTGTPYSERGTTMAILLEK